MNAHPHPSARAPRAPDDGHAFVRADVERLRLRLSRRVLWLRRLWRGDPLQSYPGLVVSEAQADRLLAAPDPAAEARFYQADPQAAAIGRSLAEAEADRACWLEEGAADAGLPGLARRFGLSRFEEEVLLLCLAPEVDPGFERIYAYVQDDVARKQPTAALALELFAGEGWPDCRAAFLPDAPLRRQRLLAPDPSGGALLTAPLRLDERIAGWLLGLAPAGPEGAPRLDGRLEALLSPVPPAPLPPGHHLLAERLAEHLAGPPAEWPVLNLVGESGAGRPALARVMCERRGVRLMELHAGRLPPPGPERDEALRLLEREAVLLGLAFYLRPPRSAPGGETPAAPDPLPDMAEVLRAPLILASEAPLAVRGARLAVHVPRPDNAAQAGLWREALAGTAARLNGAVDALAQQFDVGPGAVVRAVAAARGRARLRDGDDGALRPEDLWDACRDELSRELEGLAQRVVPRHGWDDLVLPETEARQLGEIAAQVARRAHVYDEWGFGARLSRGRGISALFAGPSGTGKTLAAEILAGHLRLDLFRVDLAGVVSKYIGETEKNLRRIFDTAEQSGAILFFDEADALFGKRSEVKDSHDRYANIEVNYLLQRMEDYRGLAILATNVKQHLDDAFLRRLRFLVDFPFPDARSRRRIWQTAFPAAARMEALDYDALSRMEVPGGNIRNIALNAAFLASDEGTPIGMAHLRAAARREYAKINKLVSAAEFGAQHARAGT